MNKKYQKNYVSILNINKKYICDLQNSINNYCDIIKNLKEFDNLIVKLINIIYLTFKSKKKVFICGNGGSAADSEHISAEFLVRLRPGINRQPYPLISLTQGAPTITACSNDFNFSDIFYRNYQALHSKGDLLICLTTSGNSENVVKVAKYALRQKNKVICFTGNKGGQISKIKNKNFYNFNIKSENVARIQEIYMFLMHFILEKVEESLLKRIK